MSDQPPNPQEAYIQAGAAVLRQQIGVLTRPQSEKLFRDAVKAADVARDLASDDLDAWHERERAEARKPEARANPFVDPDWARAFREAVNAQDERAFFGFDFGATAGATGAYTYTQSARQQGKTEQARRYTEERKVLRPAPAPNVADPHLVLGIDARASREQIQAAWRKAAKAAHPNNCGSDARLTEVNMARDAMLGRIPA